MIMSEISIETRMLRLRDGAKKQKWFRERLVHRHDMKQKFFAILLNIASFQAIVQNTALFALESLSRDNTKLESVAWIATIALFLQITSFLVKHKNLSRTSLLQYDGYYGN